MAVNSASTTVKIIIQQCLSAKLQVQPAQDDSPPQYVEVGRGIVVYVCFLKGVTMEMMPRVVKSVLNVKLSSSQGGKVSVLDLPGDVLIVPQATLGGKLKGKNVQYHSNIGKEEGSLLYQEFVTLCEQTVAVSGTDVGRSRDNSSTKVEHGTYGNLQVLSVVTNGPYTHVLEF